MVCLVKAMIFPVMYRCESWTIKKDEHQCFQIVVLEKTLKSPLDSKEIKSVIPKGNQHWIFIGRTDAESEVPILWSLATWFKELTHWKRAWCWERLRSRGEEGNRRWNGWTISLTQWTLIWAHSETVEEQGSLACCSSWSHRVGHNLATKQDLVWNVGGGHRNEKKRRDLPLQLVELWSPKKCMNLCCFCVLSLSVCLLAPNVVMEIHGKMRQLEAQIFSWITTQGSPREEETHREMAERESLKIATP